MVFLIFVINFNFVLMINTKTSSLFFLFFSIYMQSQVIESCNDVVHGIVHVHMHSCTTDIKVTSLPEDGSSGTVIEGTIRTSGKVTIIPGNIGVRIVPFINVVGRSHTTKVGGNGGNQGEGRMAHPFTIDNEETVIIFPNPIINSVTLKSDSDAIINYQLYNLYGKVLKRVTLKPVMTTTFSVTNLLKGTYVLYIQLHSGVQERKTIIKQ